MVSKTRERFIEVARQLFARKGVENTTMNDIAEASEKGRRTIYTYFKNKRDIYDAVVESESDKLIRQLNQIVAMPDTAENKLQQYVLRRFEAMFEIVERNGSLRARFFRDLRKVNTARRRISKREMALLREILQEGVDSGEFHIDNVTRTAIIITQTLHGLDVTYIRNSVSDTGMNPKMMADEFSRLLLYGVMGK